MPEFFNQPDPQQAVPGDLRGIRRDILQLLQGGSGGRLQDQGGGLGALEGLFNNPNPGSEILGPMGQMFDTRLNDSISAMNASTPGRFSSANLYQQGQLRQRSLQDYNMLSGQIRQQGQDRQLQTILALLGGVTGTAFGGPFTQGASGFQHLLGGIGAAGAIANPFGSG